MMTAASATGSRVLGEIEETTLEEVLASLRSAFSALGGRDAAAAAAAAEIATGAAATTKSKPRQQQPLKVFPIPALNGLAAKHLRATQAAAVSVSGRQLPLIYLLIATLITPPHSKTVVVVDLESRFDITRVLECTPYAAAAAAAAAAPAPAAEAAVVSSPEMPPSTVAGDVAAAAADAEEEATSSPRRQRQLHGRLRSAMPGRGPEAAPGAGATATPPVAATGQLPAERRRVSLSDLAHVHVHRPARGSGAPGNIVAEAIAAAERHMLYGTHCSGGREWWGTFVVGGNGIGNNASGVAGSGPLLPHGATPSFSSPSVDIATGPRGWLRVERGEVGGFGVGSSAEEALLDRERRQRAVNVAGWTATSVWGGFTFHEN